MVLYYGYYVLRVMCICGSALVWLTESERVNAAIVLLWILHFVDGVKKRREKEVLVGKEKGKRKGALVVVRLLLFVVVEKPGNKEEGCVVGGVAVQCVVVVDHVVVG